MHGEYFIGTAIRDGDPIEPPPPLATPQFFSTERPAGPVSYSNHFDTHLTVENLQRIMLEMTPFPALLRHLRLKTIRAAVPKVRTHPRRAILAALTTTSCRLRDIPGRSIEKWAQRLRRQGVVGYDWRVGWFLR